jgi:hypothetical protein
MDVLNFITHRRVLGPLTDELLDRLRAGEQLGPVVADLGDRFELMKGFTRSGEVARIIDHWPADHLDRVRQKVIWGLEQRKLGVPIDFHWRGDDEYPETVTNIWQEGNDLYIEFLHPPFAVAGVENGSAGSDAAAP